MQWTFGWLVGCLAPPRGHVLLIVNDDSSLPLPLTCVVLLLLITTIVVAVIAGAFVNRIVYFVRTLHTFPDRGKQICRVFPTRWTDGWIAIRCDARRWRRRRRRRRLWRCDPMDCCWNVAFVTLRFKYLLDLLLLLLALLEVYNTSLLLLLFLSFTFYICLSFSYWAAGWVPHFAPLLRLSWSSPFVHKYICMYVCIFEVAQLRWGMLDWWWWHEFRWSVSIELVGGRTDWRSFDERTNCEWLVGFVEQMVGHGRSDCWPFCFIFFFNLIF